MDTSTQFHEIHDLPDDWNVSLVSSNSSHDIELRTPTQYHAMTALLIALCISTLLMNLAVLIALLCFHKAQAIRTSPFDVLMLGVILADLLQLIPMGFSVDAVMHNLTKPKSERFCRFICCVDYGLQVVIVLLLCAVNVERYKSTNSSFRGDRTMHFKAVIVAAACWFLGIAFFIFEAVDPHRIVYSYWDVTCVLAVDHSVARTRITVGYYLILLALGLSVIVVYTVKLMVTVRRYELLQSVLNTTHTGTSPPRTPAGQDIELDELGPATRRQSRHLNLQPTSPSATSSANQNQAGARRSSQEEEDNAAPGPPQDTSLSPLNPPQTPSHQLPKRASHVKAWGIVCLVVIIYVVCFVMQFCSNLFRFGLEAFKAEGYYAFSIRFLLYLVSLFNPVLYVLYRKGLFYVDNTCGCWWCRFKSSWRSSDST